MTEHEELRQQAAAAITAASKSGKIQWEPTRENERPFLTAKRWGMKYTLFSHTLLVAVNYNASPLTESIITMDDDMAEELRNAATAAAMAMTARQQDAIELLTGTRPDLQRPIDVMEDLAEALADATAEDRITWERKERSLPYLATEVGKAEFRLFISNRDVPDVTLTGVTGDGPVGSITADEQRSYEALERLAGLTAAKTVEGPPNAAHEMDTGDRETKLLKRIIRIESASGGDKNNP